MRTFLLVSLLLGLCRLSGQTFTETHPIACGDTAYIGNLGYPFWNVARIIKKPALGHATLLGDFIPANLLQYQSPPCVTGRDTVIIECAHATQITCDTGVYIFEINCPENLQPVFTYALPCNDSMYADNLSGWQIPYLLSGPQHGFGQVIFEPADGAGVFYRPDPGFEGLDAVKVVINQGADTLLYLFQVYCDLATAQTEAYWQEAKIWPNPVGETAFLQAGPGLQHWRLTDALGRQYACAALQTAQGYQLQLGDLPPGVYWLEGRRASGARVVCRVLR